MRIVPLWSDFFTRGRRMPIRYIVVHTTEGTDSRTWLTRTGNVSAHYLVREDVIYHLVREDDVAWHAGIVAGIPTTPLYRPGVNPNDESIGIEIEGHAARDLSQLAIDTTAALIRDIRARRGPLPLVAHAQLSPARRTDPGERNFARILEATEPALSSGAMTPEQERKLDRALAILETLIGDEHWTAPMIWTARVQRGRDVERGTRYDPAVPPKDPRVIVQD